MSWSGGRKAKAPEDYERFCVMREMHWTYDELMNCPKHVYERIKQYLKTENVFYRDQRQ
jgi:enolase